MDELIQELEELTHGLLQQIDQVTDDELLTFVDARQQLIDQIMSLPVSDEVRLKYKERVTALLSYDDRILARLTSELQDAQSGLAKMDTAKRQKGAYQADYAADSYYFDKKK